MALRRVSPITTRKMLYVVSASQKMKIPRHANGPLWKKKASGSGMNENATQKFT